uniref:CCHC-type domain-containing protein n=1 Tax=Tanacetum cinerariifolium TaxID=118510 RepID=A0A6L2NU79_TANCI|nr:hypothetical protein [Tanacetum cinerariifolium]
MEQMTSLTSMCEMFCQFIQKKHEEKRIEEEQVAKAQNWKLPVCYDDDDDEERSNSMNDNIISKLPPCSAITPNEPVDSLNKVVPISEGSSKTTTETYMENYKNVSQDIRDQLNVEAEAVQIILTRIDNNIYSTVDACPNACEMARGKEIVNSPPPIYDQETSMVAEDDEMSKDKEIDKIMSLISLSFKKIYKPTNNNLQTLSNTSRANQDNSPRINRGTRYDNQRIGNVAGAKETVEQADWRDDTDDESEDQELKAHYMYMAQIQEVTPDAANDFGPIFDTEPLQKVQNNDHYNVFVIESEHPEQSESVHDTYLIEQDEHNVIIDSLDMSYDREQIDQNDDDDDLATERDLLASLIEKLKCEIDNNKNRNKFLETSNKVLVDTLKSEIKDFKNKNKSLESSNNRFKEANNKLLETNALMYKDLKKFQAELDRRNDVKYALKMEIDCAKAKGDLISYKMESQKSFNTYTQKINDLNQIILDLKKELSAHQETISILSQAKEAQIKLYKTHEYKELDKVIALENKVKVLDNIVFKTGQSVQTMNMLNSKCKTSFAKPEFLKKAQRVNPRLYDIGCYNDNLALMLAPESNEKSGIQCYNCKEFGHVARECQKPKRAKDAAYHREKMLLCKQEEAGIQLNAKQANWRDDTDDDELEDRELEVHYMYMTQLEEVSPDVADSGPIFDDEPLQKVSNDDHYNVFVIESAHPEQSKPVHDTYPIKLDVQIKIIDSLYISYNREEIDQNDDDNDLAKERELLASLIEKLKCEIDESKNRNKFLETSIKQCFN